MLVVAALDGLPAEQRGSLSRTLLEFTVSAAKHTGAGTVTHSRTVIPNPSEFEPLLFVVA